MFLNLKKKLKNAFTSGLDKAQINEPEKEENEEKPLKKSFLKKVGSISKKKITKQDFEKIWFELEIFLLEINIAYVIVEKIGKKLKETILGEEFSRFSLQKEIQKVLKKETTNVLKQREEDFLDKLNEIKDKNGFIKIIILGVNGAGKTTTIAKIISYLKKHNFSSVVSASDTFRAAAIEQLEGHCKKLNVKLVKHKFGSDPSAVAYDTIEHAKANNIDVVLIDTAGRMPNNSNLMNELKKVKKVTDSDINLFIGDSACGNDLIEQINLFNKLVPIDGVILTKVDTDEKPGSIVSTAYAIKKPIYFLGIGQGYEDLIKFEANLISDKLFTF